jgi:hypothetical protein
MQPLPKEKLRCSRCKKQGGLIVAARHVQVADLPARNAAGSGRNDELQPQGKEPMDQEARQRKLWQIGNRVKKRNFFENGLNKAEKCR